MKKVVLIIELIIIVIISSNIVSADNQCNKQTVEQLAKIIYHEVGFDTAKDSSENLFMKLTTASIVTNNASRKSGNSWYEKIYNLTDTNYSGYSSYKDKSFDEAVASRKGEMIYIAGNVLSGKYNLPKNMTLQAIKDIVYRWGTEWCHVETTGNNYDVYFGYEGDSLNSIDAFGKTITNNTVSYYKELANSLKKSDYTSYTSSTICTVLNSNQNDPTTVSYNITYELNNGSWEDNQSHPNKANVGDVIKIDNPSKTITITGDKNDTQAIIGNQETQQQTFAGWESSSSNGLENSAKIGSSNNPTTAWNGSLTKNIYFKNLKEHSGTVTLTAVWTPVNIKMPTITLDKHTCKWNTKKDGTGKSYESEESYTPTETETSLKVYAICTKEESEYKIAYDANGGTNAPKTQIKQHGVDINISNVTPIRNGYKFLSWNTKANGKGEEYQQGQDYTLDESITLYAIWLKEETKINDTSNNQSDNPKTGTPSIIFLIWLALLSLLASYAYIKRFKSTYNNI